MAGPDASYLGGQLNKLLGPGAPILAILEKIEKKTESVIQPFEVPDQVWNDFLKLRKAKKAPLTQTALDAIEREVKISGWTLEDALTECVSRGWQGFKASWVANQSNQQDEYPQRAC